MRLPEPDDVLGSVSTDSVAPAPVSKDVPLHRVPAKKSVIKRHPREDDCIAAWLLDLLAETADPFEMFADILGPALRSVPGCASVGVTAWHPRQPPTTLAASDPSAHAVLEAQYRDRQGPHRQAAETAAPVVVHDVVHVVRSADGPHHRQWAHTAHAAGITAVMSVPVAGAEGIEAVLNLNTVLPTGWPAEAVDAAEDLCDYLGTALTLAHRLNRPHPRVTRTWPWFDER